MINHWSPSQLHDRISAKSVRLMVCKFAAERCRSFFCCWEVFSCIESQNFSLMLELHHQLTFTLGQFDFKIKLVASILYLTNHSLHGYLQQSIGCHPLHRGA